MSIPFDRDLWDPGLEYVYDGEVLDSKDRPLKLHQLIKRRWGWGRASARLAANVLRNEAPKDEAARLYLHGPRRTRQQLDLFKANPQILTKLLEGLSRGSLRDVHDAEAEIDHLHIRFGMYVPEEGLTNQVLHVIAGHLGITLDELREITTFEMSPDSRVIEVDNGRV